MVTYSFHLYFSILPIILNLNWYKLQPDGAPVGLTFISF